MLRVHDKSLPTVTEARIRLAVFDCDGTLVDSQRAIVEAMTAAWLAEGLEPPVASNVRRVVGLPLMHAVARLAPERARDDHARLAGHYQEAFRDLHRRPDHEEPLYPGMLEALDALASKGMLLGVATGKGRRGLKATLDRHGLAERFVTLKTSDDGPGKPDPDMLHQAMAETGAGPRDTVMIGDTTFDVMMACAAEVAAIGVAWGYHTPDSLVEAGAALVVEDCAELPDAVDRLLSEEP